MYLVELIMTLILPCELSYLDCAHHMPLVLVALLHILFGHTFHQTIVVALQQCHCCTAYELSACTAGGVHRWTSSVGGLD